MKALVLINAQAGTVMQAGVDAVTDAIRTGLDAAGWTGDFVAESAGAIVEAAAHAGKADAVLCAGGDGTQAAVAGALMGGEAAMLPLPCGTVNLFCRDLGLPMTIGEAVETGLAAPATPIDIGLVNGEVFVNNVVFGAYAELAEAREDLRHAENFEDASFALTKAADALLHSEAARYAVDLDGDRRSFKSNTLIVSNNPFTGAIDLLPRRARLDMGALAVYLAEAQGGFDFTARLAEFLTGSVEASDFISHHDCARCDISSRRLPLVYTVDGDPRETEGPVSFEIKRDALKVFYPALQTS